MRELSGTNPAMATGGFTGRRGGGPGDAGGGGAAIGGRGAAAPALQGPRAAHRPQQRRRHPASTARSRPQSRWPMAARGRASLLAQSEVSAVLLENGRFQLLSKDGAVYREKPITPKADWTHYDGSLTGNRYSPLELINPSNVQRLGAAWLFPIPSNPRALQSTPVVQDGIMYVTGWNEIYALDATTGRQIWTYSEAAPRRHSCEAGIGTNRGVTISGDKAFMVTDHAHLLGVQSIHGAEVVGRRDGLAPGVVQLDVAAAARRRPARRRRRGRRGRRARISRRLSRVDRRARLALVLDSEARRKRLGDLDRPGARAWLRRDVDARLVRSAARPDLLGDRQSVSRHRGRRAHRRQPLHVERRRARRKDRRDEVVLPVHARTTPTTGMRCSRCCSSTRCGRASRASC